jgi:hypothetical protein
MRYASLMLMCLLSCRSRPNHYEVKLQDGDAGYRLDCDKTQFTNQECINEAARICAPTAALIMDDANNGIYTVVRCQ